MLYLCNLCLLGDPLEVVLQRHIEVKAVRTVGKANPDESTSAVVIHYLDHKVPREVMFSNLCNRNICLQRSPRTVCDCLDCRPRVLKTRMIKHKSGGTYYSKWQC